MTSKTISYGIIRAVAIIAGILLLLHFLYTIQSVIAYLAIAAVVALIGRPIVIFLRRKLKLPNTIAVILTMFLMVSIFAGVVALFVPLITEQSRNLSLLDIDNLQKSLDSLYWEATEYFGASPNVVNEMIEEADLEKTILKD
ncbi:MAG: AI-2E family transporter, partial [Flavobacteriales bacterium]